MGLNSTLISENHEFYEVVNAFPFLSKFLHKIEIETHQITEGETIKEYLLKKDFSESEILNLVTKFNSQVKVHLEPNTVSESKVKVNQELVLF